MSHLELIEGPAGLAPPIPEHVAVHLLADLYDNPALLEPPVAIVERFAYQGRVTLFAAPRKSGKSTLTGAIAAALSNGQTFLREVVARGTVVWVAADEPLGDVVRRFQGCGADRAGVYVVEPPVSIAEVVVVTRSLAPQLLVIDTISDLTAREIENENDSLAVKRALEPFRQLARDTDTAVLLLHHTTKANNRSRGSGVFEDMADLILHLGIKSDDPTVRTIEAEGRIPVDSFEVRWGERGFELADGELSLIQRVRLAIYARPGSSKREIRESVKGRAEAVNVAINRLTVAGEVVDRGSQNHSALHVVENHGNHSGNHSPNSPGTARESLGTTPEPVAGMASGSPPLGGTATTGTTRGEEQRAAA